VLAEGLAEVVRGGGKGKVPDVQILAHASPRRGPQAPHKRNRLSQPPAGGAEDRANSDLPAANGSAGCGPPDRVAQLAIRHGADGCLDKLDTLGGCEKGELRAVAQRTAKGWKRKVFVFL